MALRLLASVVCAAAILAGCATQCSENFPAVREGMTKTEIQDLLGKPSSTWLEDGGIERWQWGDNLSTLATGGVFHDADTSKVWVVWFDRDGRVQDSSEPAWVERR